MDCLLDAFLLESTFALVFVCMNAGLCQLSAMVGVHSKGSSCLCSDCVVLRTWHETALEYFIITNSS